MKFSKFILNYFKGVYLELQKVSFPTKPQIAQRTGIVLATVLLSTLIIGVMDYGISQVLKLIII